jgi:hypothetical protein
MLFLERISQTGNGKPVVTVGFSCKTSSPATPSTRKSPTGLPSSAKDKKYWPVR